MAEITFQQPSRSVTRVNELDTEEAQRAFAACCSARKWIEAVVSARPYGSLDDLLNASDAALADLTEDDIAEALAAHPRIGARANGDDREAGWSRREQAGAAAANPALARALAEGNAAYEDRFDRVFLICASGLSAAEMLSDLRIRLANDPATERAVVREELRKITRLRLRALVEELETP